MAELDADAAAFLERLRAAAAPVLQDGTPEQARAAHVASAAVLSGPGEDVAEVVDGVVGDGVGDGVPVRTYRPEGAHGTTVYVHGGGWVVGTLDTYDPLCRALANSSGTTVVSVGYTLAPQARHPVQVEQVLTVLRSLPAPLAVAGDSAGGHLAALAAGLAVREQVPLAALALLYPVVRPQLDTPSARDNATGYNLETDGMRWYWQHYLPTGSTDIPVDSSAQDLAGLPSTLVLTAGFDPLRDEALALAERLETSGVPVHRLAYDGQVHGFLRMLAVIREGREALAAVGAFLAARMAAPGQTVPPPRTA